MDNLAHDVLHTLRKRVSSSPLVSTAARGDVDVVVRSPGHREGVSFEFKEYAPGSFAALRRAYGVDDAMFYALFETESVEVLGRLGRSGSLLLRCGGGQLVMKSLSREESRFACHVLPSLIHHTQIHPHTLLTPMLALFGVRRTGSGLTGRFLICGNATGSTRPTDLYDLKGSIVDRRTNPADRATGAAGKDQDLERRFSIHATTHDWLMNQLRADVSFLSSQRIMDYSLLVGVRPTRDENGDSVLGWTAWHVALTTSETVFLGLLDYLQPYTLWKRAARLAKTLQGKSRSGISNTPPPYYAQRFLRFLENVFTRSDQQT